MVAAVVNEEKKTRWADLTMVLWFVSSSSYIHCCNRTRVVMRIETRLRWLSKSRVQETTIPFFWLADEGKGKYEDLRTRTTGFVRAQEQ